LHSALKFVERFIALFEYGLFDLVAFAVVYLLVLHFGTHRIMLYLNRALLIKH